MEDKIINRRKALKQFSEALFRGQELNEMYKEYQIRRKKLLTALKEQMEEEEYESKKEIIKSTLQEEYADILEKYHSAQKLNDDIAYRSCGLTFEEMAQILENENVAIVNENISNFMEELNERITNDLYQAIEKSDLLDVPYASSNIICELGKACALEGLHIDEIPKEALFDYCFIVSYLENITCNYNKRESEININSRYIEFIHDLQKQNSNNLTPTEVLKNALTEASTIKSDEADSVKSSELNPDKSKGVTK